MNQKPYLLMKTHYLTKKTFSLAAFSALVFCTSQAHADETQTHDLDGIEKLEFHITKANIQLAGSNRSDLQLHLEEATSDFDPDKVTQTVERDGETLVIKIEYKKESSWLNPFTSNSGYKSATLSIPSTLPTSVHTKGGNIDAESINAPLSLNTSGGNIEASEINGSLKAKTSGGNIDLEEIGGDILARTSGGNIKLDDANGRADLKTSGGNIKVEGNVSAVQAHTSGGNIKVKLTTQCTEPLLLSTSGGNVSARLSQGITAPAELSSSGGNVSIELPSEQGLQIEAKSTDRVSLEHSGTFKGQINKRKIEGALNGGGPLASLKTSGGKVSISNL